MSSRRFILALSIALVQLGAPSVSAAQAANLSRYRTPLRGLYVQFERRGWSSEFWSGQVLQSYEDFDSVLGRTVREEVEYQLRLMSGMGINRITLELRAADGDGDSAFPLCHVSPALGLRWPQPTGVELRNLKAFFDLVDRLGIKVWLRLVNTHMEEVPRTRSAQWLGAILGTLKGHPALDLVLFEGNIRQVDLTGDGVSDACGIAAEPPLWLGPTSAPARYVRWALSYGRSLGLPARRLSAQAVVGDAFIDSQPPNPTATDGHLWSPIVTLRRLFDLVGFPAAKRTYAISLYEHSKCTNLQGSPCVDADPHLWADETLGRVFDVVGRGNGARVLAPEMGLYAGQAAWRTEWALESLITLMEKHGVQGGAFWRWTSFETREDADPQLAEPVKRRGVDLVYNRVQQEVLDWGGAHLTDLPNSSFEEDADGDRLPDRWKISGRGQAERIQATADVASRGRAILRLTTGEGIDDAIQARSGAIPVAAGVLYTTAIHLKFRWSQDPNPNGRPDQRPTVFLAAHYLGASGTPLAGQPPAVLRLHQEDGVERFETFVLQFLTPAGTTGVVLEIGAERRGLSSPVVLEADNLR